MMQNLMLLYLAIVCGVVLDVSYSMSFKPLVIGTRGSPLALAQAYETKRLLGLHFPDQFSSDESVEIKKIMTKVRGCSVTVINIDVADFTFTIS